MMIGMCLIGAAAIFFQEQKAVFSFEQSGGMQIVLTEGMEEQAIKLWKNDEDGKYYFFMPSFVKQTLWIGETGGKQITWNGQNLFTGLKIRWEDNQSNVLEIHNEEKGIETYEIVFLRSSKIPAIFIESESGNMEFIHEAKENEEKGDINVFMPEGGKYSGSLEKISMRGNSTKSYPKKPYAIRLSEEIALCGMNKSKRWNLIAGWREGNKMNSKVAYDMAKMLGEGNSVSSTWVDLYMNGEYSGVYLLCEAISIGNHGIDIYDLEKANQKENPNIEDMPTFTTENAKGYILNDPEVIDGGYLVEKEHDPYWKDAPSGFITDAGQYFVIKEPKQASKAQVEYIRSFFQNIENLMGEEGIQWSQYFDTKSLVRQFLIDEITMNYDAGVTSMFFYKDKGDELIYLGPPWDYDTALGTVPPFIGDYTRNNYAGSMFEVDRGLRPWYKAILSDEEFQKEIINQYTTLLPYIEYLLEQGIDEYANLIRESMKMEEIRWGLAEKETIVNAGHYRTFEANVNFLKYFLAKRINFLNEKWNTSYDKLQIPANGQSHRVILVKDGMPEEEFNVEDGQVITELPMLDESKYAGWYFEYSNEEYRDYIPIYEETVLEARPLEK